ncbi:MAG: apolipoprotein N-acyltransferase [Candidatus Eisenbacteria bacterium]|nr:apolipoprotein N-acyltransferase [Candidatus Latescibacterota bacterium]MBD3301834.1 apolipoprotein N-acyltransferase [Candidatus Eisenbacteria bacterium]
MRVPGQGSGLLLALLSGVLSSLAFPPVGWTPLVLVAPVPLLRALAAAERLGLRRAFLLGWIAGLFHFLLAFHWILSLPNEEVTIPGIMIPSLLFMSAYLAVYSGFAAAFASGIARRLRLPVGLVWPLFAALAEYARSIGPLGFPWGIPAYALVDATPILQIGALTGFWGLTFWVALCGGLLDTVVGVQGRRRAGAAACLVLVALLPWIYGFQVLRAAPTDRVDGPTGLSVSLIQPNTSREIKWDPRYREIVVGDLLERTRAAAETEPDLIVWPETAAPILLLQEPIYLGQVQETVRELGIPLLAGTLDHSRVEGVYESHNSAALFDAEGLVQLRYDKQRLVPFSERMPFRDAVPWLAGLNFGQSDFTPGRRNVLFPADGTRFGVLICFESIFPDLARRFADEGAEMLVNITNDFWFGRNAAPVQHADMAVFRAVETRRPLLRCANTGISMVVDPWGRISHRTALFVEDRIDVRIVPSREKSFYVRHGEWLLKILAGLAGALLAAALLAPRRPAP